MIKNVQNINQTPIQMTVRFYKILLPSFLLGILLFLLSIPAFAQAPEGINYQAVVRDVNGNVLSQTMINVRFAIISGAPNGTLEYEEEYFMSITTNDFGLFSAVIGGGQNLGTGAKATFSDIDWGADAHYLRVEVEYNGSYELLSNTQLISVPYALYAKRSGNIFKSGAGIQVFNNDSIVNTGDLSDTNELQGIFVNAAQDSILITGAGGISVDDLIFPEDQQLSISNDTLFLTGVNPSAVPLMPILGLDSLSGINDTTLRAFYANGNSFDIILRGADTSNVNELVDSLVLNNAVLELYQQGSLRTSVDLDTLGRGKRDSLIDAISDLEIRLVADSARMTDSITSIRADLNQHLIDDNDTSSSNELINSIVLNGTTLEVTDSGGTFFTDLSSLIGPDDQNLLLNPARDSILIEDGSGISIKYLLDSIGNVEARYVADSIANADSIASLRADLNLVNVIYKDTSEVNELVNSFTLTGTVLELVDSGGTYTVDLSVLPSINTDEQDLSINAAGDSILIENGAGVSIQYILDSLTNQRNDINQNRSDISDNRDSLVVHRNDINQNRTDIGIINDTLPVLRTDINQNRSDISDNRDSLVVHRTDINQNRTEIGINRDSLIVHRTDINQIRTDVGVIQDTLTDLRTDINLNRDSLGAHRIDINQNRTDILINRDSLVVHRTDINQNRTNLSDLESRYVADSTLNADSLAAHRIDINQNRTDILINRDSLVRHRLEFNQLRGRYLADSARVADSLANQRAEFNQLRIRYLNDSTDNADSLARHRFEILNLRARYLADSTDNADSLARHRFEILNQRARYLADSTANADSLARHRFEILNLRSRYLADSARVADSLADQRSEFNQLRVRYLADSTRNADSLADQRAEFNQLRIRYLNDSTDNADSLARHRFEILNLRTRYLADSTDNADSLARHRFEILNQRARYLADSTANADSLARHRFEILNLRTRYLADSTRNADSLADQRAEFNQLRIRYLNDSTANTDSLIRHRAEINQLRTRYVSDSARVADSLARHRFEILNLRTRYLADSTDNADSLARLRFEILNQRARYLADSTANADSLARHRFEILNQRARYLADSTDNADSLARHRFEILDLRTRYLADSTDNADSIIALRNDILNNRSDLGDLETRYLADSTLNSDTLIAHRVDINQNRTDLLINRDSLVVHRTDINTNRDSLVVHRSDINTNRDSLVVHRSDINTNRDSLVVHRNDINTNRDSLVVHRSDINTNRDSLVVHRSDINTNRDSLVVHRSDINTNRDSLVVHRSDINTNRDSLVVHRTDINTNRDSIVVHRSDINTNRDSLVVHRTDINFNRRELDSLQVRFAADSTNNADSITAIRTDLNQHIVLDNDTSSSNELNATVILNGTDLEVTDAGGTIITDLSPLTSPDVVVDTSKSLRLAFWKNIDTLSFFDDFYLDTTNLRIGLGTTTPDSKFHIAEDIDGGFAELRIENLNNQDGSQIVFEENGQGNNFTLRYRSDASGTGNWFQILGDQETVVGLIVERDRGDVGVGIPVDTDPTAKLDVAGAIRVDTAQLTPVEGMIEYRNNDFRGYDGTQWRSFLDTATCPAGMTNINGRFCVETNERAAASWYVAATTCMAAGYKLPTRAEWFGAVSIAFLVGETDNWEWVENTEINNVGKAGNGAATAYATENPVNSEAYRCILYLK
ncbi:MAG: hypothetical protein CMP59_03560 [Flavobacteriales bacterium]|nr:hypothetical protein [Flavobacteriales bacterium]